MDSSPRGIWVDPGHGPFGERSICVIDSHGNRLLAGLIPPQADEEMYATALRGLS